MFRLLIKSILFSLFVAGIYFSSCKREFVPPEDVGYAYFPSNQGHWVLYDVDSTYYDEFYQTVNNFHFQIKEIIESDFYDNESRLTQRIERYKKTSDTTNWFLKDVWVSNLTPSTAEKVEENLRYVKLIFPIIENKTWNGNAFNTLGSQDYEYDNVFNPYTVNTITFDSTITVIQKVEDFLTQESYQIEVYARNVGLIYKRYKEVKKIFNPAQPSQDSIVSGIDYTYNIISYGNQ